MLIVLRAAADLGGPMLPAPAPDIEANERYKRWIDDHAHLLDEYAEVGREIDRRVTARALLYQTDPPQDLLEQIGARSESPDPHAWDAAVAVPRHDNRSDPRSTSQTLPFPTPGSGGTSSSSPSNRQPPR